MSDQYRVYSEYLMKLFKVEDDYGFHASVGLPLLDELYDAQGKAKASEYTNDKVHKAIESRNKLVMQAIEMKAPSAMDKVRVLLYGK